MTRGTSFDNQEDTIRIYVWPRTKFIGKEVQGFIFYSTKCMSQDNYINF